MHTSVKYRVLGTSTAAIFFQMIILSKNIYTSDERYARFHWHETRIPDQVECLDVFCMLKADTGLVKLYAICQI